MNKKDVIEGTPQFVPVKTWYDLMFQLETAFLEHMEANNVNGMIIIYRYKLSKFKPYITQYATSETLKKLDVEEIYGLREELKEGEADFVFRHNNKIYTQINSIIMEKIDLLNSLVAKAELYLPLKKVDRRPASFAQDGQ